MYLQNTCYFFAILSVILTLGYTDVKNANEIFIDKLMEDYDAQGAYVPGASVAVICKRKLAIHRSYGFADIEKNVRATSATNYRLASLTKQFTAAAVLLLTEKKNGQLQLDDLIRRKWLPMLPLATDEITIRHLLTHTSGIIDYEDVLIPDNDLNNQLDDYDVLDILTSQNQTYFTPGSRYQYSNSGYALLALIIEKASGKRFADFLREQIFLPLTMYNSVAYEKNISTVLHRAFGYSGNGSSWLQTDQSQTSAVLGDGGIYSSIDDLIKWDTALFDDRLLSFESLQLAFSPATSTDDPAVQYGMGWKITGDMVWHDGSTIGFRNVFLRFPNQNLSVILLTNRNRPEPYKTALTIANYFLCTNDCVDSHSCSSAYNFAKRESLVFFITLYLLSLLFFKTPNEK